MCRTRILFLMAILGSAAVAVRVRHRVSSNIIAVALLVLPIMFIWLFINICVPNDRHDHGGNSSNDHVIDIIKELPVVNPSALLRSIPVVDFNSRNFGDGIECVVCLSELADEDKTKLLPSCKHWFHAHCIDMWLRLHATCPICRERVRLFQSDKPRSELSSPVGPPAASSQDANPGNPAVVVDGHIPIRPELGELGPLHP